MDSLAFDPAIIAAIVSAVLAVVGLTGIVVPVLPGSILIAVGLLVWAIFGGTVWGWVAFAVGALLVAAGMISGWILTGRGLREQQVPSRTVTIAIAAGIVGMFVLPAFGLPIGFALGLVGAEYSRVRDWRKALDSSVATLKALGIGMLIELACGLTATMILAASIAAHFIWLAG